MMEMPDKLRQQHPTVYSRGGSSDEYFTVRYHGTTAAVVRKADIADRVRYWMPAEVPEPLLEAVDALERGIRHTPRGSLPGIGDERGEAACKLLGVEIDVPPEHWLPASRYYTITYEDQAGTRLQQDMWADDEDGVRMLWDRRPGIRVMEVKEWRNTRIVSSAALGNNWTAEHHLGKDQT